MFTNYKVLGAIVYNTTIMTLSDQDGSSLVAIPIPTFSACNIEKVGIGMGYTRLDGSVCNIWTYT